MTRIVRHLSGFTGCARGASAVEFAILAPLFFAILFGIVIFGSYLAVVHGVQQLAAEAARRSVAGLTDTERGSLASDYVSANAQSYPLIDGAHLTVTAAASATDSKVFVVTVNYDASHMFIYALPAFVPMPASTIVRSAAIPFGGY
jgi:Flp pilus assembly protein TadG